MHDLPPPPSACTTSPSNEHRGERVRDWAMSDQSSAATEHAVMREVAAPLAGIPEDPLSTVAHVDFPLTLRGYERRAVDAYVKRTSALVAELHAARAPEVAVRRALERVGEEVAGVLERAHETARQITAQSRREADERLRKAHREAEQIAAAAQRRLVTLDTDTDRIWDERRRTIDDIRELAAELLELADSAAERLAPAEPAGDDEPTADDEPADDAESATEVIQITPRTARAAGATTELPGDDKDEPRDT
jgi:cell division septum initiation protein DivIVA